MVVKGHNNTIQYNCTGKGFRGIGVFANDQALIANNTFRCELDRPIEINVQSSGGTNVDNTTIRDNILENVVNQDDICRLTSELNTYNQNIYFGDEPQAQYVSTTYDLETEFSDFKTAIGDSNAQFLDPEFTGSDDTSEAYYVPRNQAFNSISDTSWQSVGAVDITNI
jgi:hypothetical protein